MKRGDIVQVTKDWRPEPATNWHSCQTEKGLIGHIMLPGFPNKEAPQDPMCQVEFSGPIPFNHPDFMLQNGRYATHVNYIPMSCLRVIGYSSDDIMLDKIVEDICR